MRVLYVNHTSQVSGGEGFLITLLDNLPADVEPVVACPPGPFTDLLRSKGVDVVPIRGTDLSLRLHPRRTPEGLLELARAAVQVRRAAATVDADLVHANSVRAGLIAVPNGKPTVVHVHDCLPAGKASSLALHAVSRTDALIANSAYTGATLGRYSAGAHIIHYAIDTSPFESGLDPETARARLGLRGDGPVLAVVAQITPWKAQDDAITIAARLRPSLPGLQLLLVGSAKFTGAATRYDNLGYLADLERQVAELDLADLVHFLGQRDDVPAILKATDLLLLPSWEEPFGLAIIEAMAAEVPVAATDVGGPPEIVEDGRTGLLLPPRDPDAWAAAILPLLRDRDALYRMGTEGPESVRSRFGVNRHVEQIHDVYMTVLARRSLSLGRSANGYARSGGGPAAGGGD